tara:strand:- start:168 stop:455 length:288 start_codon:yes stop_codon:yes gene_type:complete
MTKQEIGDQVAEETGIDRDVVRKVFNGVISVIKKQLLFGVNCHVYGLVNFTKVRKEARIARDPRNGEKVDLPAHYVIRTILSKSFLKQIKEQKVY